MAQMCYANIDAQNSKTFDIFKNIKNTFRSGKNIYMVKKNTIYSQPYKHLTKSWWLMPFKYVDNSIDASPTSFVVVTYVH